MARRHSAPPVRLRAPDPERASTATSQEDDARASKAAGSEPADIVGSLEAW